MIILNPMVEGLPWYAILLVLLAVLRRARAWWRCRATLGRAQIEGWMVDERDAIALTARLATMAVPGARGWLWLGVAHRAVRHSVRVPLGTRRPCPVLVPYSPRMPIGSITRVFLAHLTLEVLRK